MFDFEKELLTRILKEDLTQIGIEGLITLGNGYAFGIETEDGNSVTVVTELDKHNLKMFSILDEHSNPDNPTMMRKVGELLHRINIKMIVGKFTLDFDDGTIMYYSSHSFCDDLPKANIYEKHLIILCMMLDQFLPGIRNVINGVKEPVEAYDDCYDDNAVALRIKNHLSRLLDVLSDTSEEIYDSESPSDENESGTTEISFSKTFEEMIKHIRENELPT